MVVLGIRRARQVGRGVRVVVAVVVVEVEVGGVLVVVLLGHAGTR